MPQLIVFAGCNGAGKSTLASSFLPDHLKSFDYDKIFLNNYEQLPDSEFRYEMADRETESTFLEAIATTIEKNAAFCHVAHISSRSFQGQVLTSSIII